MYVVVATCGVGFTISVSEQGCDVGQSRCLAAACTREVCEVLGCGTVDCTLGLQRIIWSLWILPLARYGMWLHVPMPPQ